ncbi:MAG TPA: AAA family ATPase [Enhygromyxa sp.]|nr:AAA family ATPase [Enhygromyxa sp.]
MATPKSSEPTDMGRLSTIDPLTLEPGMIVWDRFCVVGKVRHASPLWYVPVTDLAREYGRPPHHRVTLAYLPVDDRHRERIRRAVVADEQVQPRVRATIDLARGMALVHEPVEGEHVGAQLPARESRTLTLALSGLLTRLHEANVRGIDLRSGDLRQSEGQFRLDGFHHLTGAGTAEQDLEGVVALLRRVAGAHVGSLLEPMPRSAGELWGRARILAQEDHTQLATPLSQHPPFVGRERARRTLEKAFADAKIARSSVGLVCGAQGLGKSRLLEEFASWLRAEERALVVHGEYLRGCGESRAGLMGALGGLPKALASCEPELTERVRERLARRVGAHAGVLASYAPGFAELLAEPADEDPFAELPNFEFEEGFARHAVAVAEAIRCIGSQERPLVILLDNLQFADRGSIAVLRRLLVEDRSHHTMIVAGLCGQAPTGLADASDDSNWNPLRDPQLLLRRIVLDPFELAELERLLLAGLPGPVERPHELAEALFEGSRGNPLVAWATLQSWIDRNVLVRPGAEPWTLRKRMLGGTSPRRVFGERVDQAGLDERWLALLAAAAGGHVDEAWFQRVSGWEPRRVATAVEGLERRGLMGRAGEASLRFPHDMVRELVVERTPAGDVRRAHAAIASWLASLGPRVSPARLAYHTDCALGQDSHGDAQLAEMHLAAGREMLGVFDLERSGWHFTRALIERGKGTGRLAAVEGAADVALLGDKVEEAAQLYAEAVIETDDPLVASRIAAKAVHGLFRKSAAGEAATIGRLALARADQPLPDGGVRLRVAKLQAQLRLRFELRQAEHALMSSQLREQLCWLYSRMAVVLTVPEPSTAELCLLRALHHARGLESAAAASVHAMHGASLAMGGHTQRAQQALRRAVELAMKVRSDWALALAQHLRGHLVELPTGEYLGGLASLDEAVSHFRRTGDLSIAVSSLFFKAVYGRDREPIQVLHGWLDEATALNEVQGDTVVDLAIEALRLYLRARTGARNVVEAAASLSVRAAARSPVSFEGYLPHAYLALALLEVGEQARAREQIEQSVRARIGDHAPEFAHDLTAATVLVLVRTQASPEDRGRLEDGIRTLEKAGRHSPRLAALAQLARMRHAMSQARRERARAAAASLIAGLGQHGQIHLALEAHRTLGELLRGSDVLAAREHVRLAQELAEKLGLEQARERERERERAVEEQDIPRARTRDRSSRRHSNAYLRAVARNEVVEVGELLESSRQVLLDTVGSVSWIYLRAQPELRVHGEQVEVQTLLVHLALCARDSVSEPEQLRAVGTLEDLDAERAATIPGASAGRWGKIAVTVLGAPANLGVTGGVSACRQSATRLGGFLEVEQTEELLTLSVYLPPERTGSSASMVAREVEPGPSGVYVLHPDPLIRETLVGAITRLGHPCESGSPNDVDFRELPEVDVLFVDGETLHDYAKQLPHEPTTVEIVSRGLRRASEFPSLRVPFALGELKKYLDRDD